MPEQPSTNTQESNRPRMKIENNIPINTVGIETKRERDHYTYLPPQNYVHVWWARRPTPAARLSVLASVLPDTVDDDTLLKWMCIDPNNKPREDSIAGHVRKKQATKGNHDGAVYEHFGYRKIWTQEPSTEIRKEVHEAAKEAWGGEVPTILDATAGGGTIPFESIRYEFPTIANELNPVASVVLKAVLEHPRVNGDLSEDIRKWGMEVNERSTRKLEEYFPSAESHYGPANYLWSHTVTCPDCGLELPLAPNWWIDKESASEGKAVRPSVKGDSIEFELVELPSDVEKSEFNPTDGSVSYGKGECLKCGVTIDGEEIKAQAQAGQMNTQLYCIEYRDVRDDSRGHFRTPSELDKKAIKKAEQQSESDPELSSFLNEDRFIGLADRSANYGITQWKDMFKDRQLLTHYSYLQSFEEVKEEVREEYPEEEANVILTFLALVADKAVDYNSKMCAWIPSATKIGHSFDRHDFSFKWTFAEINLTAEDIGYEWMLENTLKAYDDLKDLSGYSESPTQVLQEDAADLSIESESVEAIVLDPPYYDNVMYAELSDFFYVWMKQYLGDVYPEFFTEELTNKHQEAVANPAKFDDVVSEGGSKRELAKQDYEDKMTDIFEEMQRVLRDDGIFTLMFTHKMTEAWDTLTKALIESGFVVKSTHPISTERADSLHQKGKNAAESTILLTSEKRDSGSDSISLWSNIKKKTRKAARQRVQELDEQGAEFTKVDMILASFGPTLEVFTGNYPVVDDEGNEIEPQTALDEARNAVRDYLIDEYLNEGIREADPKTEWYIFSWLMFEAQQFPYDEARRLAIGLGEELDDLKRSHRMWRKKSGDVVLRYHEERVQDLNKKQEDRSGRKPVDPEAISFATALDKVHAALHVYDGRGATEAWNYLDERNLGADPGFKATLEALLRVLPHETNDWQLARDLAAGETGDLLDLDLEKSIFEDRDENQGVQTKLSDGY